MHKLVHNYNSCVSIKLPPFNISYKESVNTFTLKWKFFKIVKEMPCSCFTQNKTLGCAPHALFYIKHLQECFNIYIESKAFIKITLTFAKEVRMMLFFP